MVNNIIQKKEKLMESKRDENKNTSENDDSSDDIDPEFEQMIDWRSKKVIKWTFLTTVFCIYLYDR